MGPLTRVTDFSIGVSFPCSIFPGLPSSFCVCPWISVHITGSPNVFANNLPAMRMFDLSVTTCPFDPIQIAVTGAPRVKINNLSAHRVNDVCVSALGIGMGIVATGSPNVMIGD